jgi:hypothetical protein
MATSPAPLAASIRDRTASQVFCPSCAHELDDWEIHLLKFLDCPFCGGSLELGAAIPMTVAIR